MPNAPTPPIKDIVITSKDPELVEILKEIKQILDIREGRLGDTGFRFIDYYELIELLAGDETITVTVLPSAHNHPHNDLSAIQGGTTDEYYHLTLAEYGVIGTPAHNDTTGKQGGTAGEYYHLTSAEYSALGDHPDHNDLANIQGGSATERYHLTAAQHGNLHDPDKIFEGDSRLEIVDTGTGIIYGYADNNEVLRLYNLGGRIGKTNAARIDFSNAGSGSMSMRAINTLKSIALESYSIRIGDAVDLQTWGKTQILVDCGVSPLMRFSIGNGAGGSVILMDIDSTSVNLPVGLLETNTATPIDLTVDCGTEKTIELAQPVWDDVKVTPGAFQFSGSGDPTLIDWQPGGSGATFKVWAFDKNQQVFALVQMPHKYKEGTDLEFHIHWTPHDRGVIESGNAVGWKVDYSIANVNGTFLASSTADLSDLTTGTDDKHEITDSVVVSGTGLTISHIIMLRIYRSDTGADDTWNTNAPAGNRPVLLEFDIHFEIDTMGSRQNFIK